MPDDLGASPTLYERDILAWSRQQASALRTRGAGGNALDYDNLAEEIEDVGKSQLQACESQLENIIKHLLKIEYVRSPETIPHWQAELREFRRQLGRRLTGTIANEMRPRLHETFAEVAGDLQIAKLISTEDAVEGVLREPYSWEEALDKDFYPEPRYD